jgi:tetratricopeptide (TPR) repeat protein
VDEAVAQFQAALQINPGFAQARRGLAYCWFRKGRVEDATAELRKFVEAEPARADGHDELGTALLTGGKVDEAIAEFEKALQLQPDYANAAVSLGRAALALAMHPDPAATNGARALELARRADQLLGGRNAVVKDALAVALIGTGHPNEALAAARQALDLATAQGDTQAAALARQEIAKCEAAAK